MAAPDLGEEGQAEAIVGCEKQRSGARPAIFVEGGQGEGVRLREDPRDR
jgi:hypothetical protein